MIDDTVRAEIVEIIPIYLKKTSSEPIQDRVRELVTLMAGFVTEETVDELSELEWPLIQLDRLNYYPLDHFQLLMFYYRMHAEANLTQVWEALKEWRRKSPYDDNNPHVKALGTVIPEDIARKPAEKPFFSRASAQPAFPTGYGPPRSPEPEGPHPRIPKPSNYGSPIELTSLPARRYGTREVTVPKNTSRAPPPPNTPPQPFRTPPFDSRGRRRQDSTSTDDYRPRTPEEQLPPQRPPTPPTPPRTPSPIPVRGQGPRGPRGYRGPRGHGGPPGPPGANAVAGGQNPQNQGIRFDDKFKTSQIPSWNGDKQAIIPWISKMNDLARLGPAIYNSLGRWVPTRLEDEAATWWMSLSPDIKATTATWREYYNLMERDWMTLEWFSDEQARALRMGFRDKANPEESPRAYIARKAMHLEFTLGGAVNEQAVINYIMEKAPKEWGIILNIGEVMTVDELKIRANREEGQLLRANRQKDDLSGIKKEIAELSRKLNGNGGPKPYRTSTHSAEVETTEVEVHFAGRGDKPRNPFPQTKNRIIKPLFPKRDDIRSEGKTPGEKGAGPCQMCSSLNHWDKDCPHFKEGREIQKKQREQNLNKYRAKVHAIESLEPFSDEETKVPEQEDEESKNDSSSDSDSD